MTSLDTFIEQTSREKTPQGVFALFQATLGEMGYDRICYSLITDHPSLGLKAGHGVLRNYPDDWMAHYVARGYQYTDPVPKHAFRTSRPFTWASLSDVVRLTEPEKAVMTEAQSAGLLSGVGVPLYGVAGEIAGVGLASTDKGADQDRLTLQKLHAISAQFHMMYTEYQSPLLTDKPPIVLSQREREILHWAAEGKSDQVIADIMGISYPTVRFHMNNIFKKLGANERTLAVVKAIRLGLILPSYVFSK